VERYAAHLTEFCVTLKCTHTCSCQATYTFVQLSNAMSIKPFGVLPVTWLANRRPCMIVLLHINGLDIRRKSCLHNQGADLQDAHLTVPSGHTRYEGPSLTTRFILGCTICQVVQPCACLPPLPATAVGPPVWLQLSVPDTWWARVLVGPQLVLAMQDSMAGACSQVMRDAAVMQVGGLTAVPHGKEVVLTGPTRVRLAVVVPE
jgi:hypothetical protein